MHVVSQGLGALRGDPRKVAYQDCTERVDDRTKVRLPNPILLKDDWIQEG
jgi:hypothetical protein